MEEKVFEYKLKSLIELRTTLVGTIAILSGGVMWLMFLDAPKYRYFFVAFGFYFICVFAVSLMKTITELNAIFYKRRNVK